MTRTPTRIAAALALAAAILATVIVGSTLVAQAGDRGDVAGVAQWVGGAPVGAPAQARTPARRQSEEQAAALPSD